MKGKATVSEQASRFGVHPTMINQWKRALLDGASSVFERGGRKATRSAAPDHRGSALPWRPGSTRPRSGQDRTGCDHRQY
nr:hypothetical protein [Rhodovulum sulfidophilum]